MKDDGTSPDAKAAPKYTGPDGERLRWVDGCIEQTREWIRRERAESDLERMMSAPGSWDYDYNTDIVLICKQAEITVEALLAEREVIVTRQRHLRRDTDAGEYAHE